MTETIAGREAASDERVEVVEKTTPYRGYFQVDSYRLRHRRFEGGWTDVMQREVFERGHAAAVLPYDPERDTVVLIEQFRVGALAAGLEPWLIEIVAGIIEPGESAESVVQREALEEAGCQIGELIEIGRFLPSPGGCSETLTIYCARTDSRGLGGIHGLAEEQEDIRVLVAPWVEARELLESGRIVNAFTALALQWLALNREPLRHRWTA